MKNILKYDGTGEYYVYLWFPRPSYRDGQAGDWGTIARYGHLVRMFKPVKGQFVRLSTGELCKVINTGTENMPTPGENQPQGFRQVPAVYLKRIEG